MGVSGCNKYCFECCAHLINGHQRQEWVHIDSFIRHRPVGTPSDDVQLWQQDVAYRQTGV